ncbi:hypothetical protein MKX03_035099, partial [Papaver bracteatum]
KIVGDLPIYQEGMNVDQIFDYFTIMGQVLSSRYQEKDEHKPLCPTFSKVINDGKIEDFGELLYDIELEDTKLGISREQSQIGEPMITGNKFSLEGTTKWGIGIHIDPIWSLIEDKIHGSSHHARLRELLDVSLLLGDVLNYNHKVLYLVSNYNGRCRGRIVYKQGRSSSTNGAYALKNSRANLFK